MGTFSPVTPGVFSKLVIAPRKVPHLICPQERRFRGMHVMNGVQLFVLPLTVPDSSSGGTLAGYLYSGRRRFFWLSRPRVDNQ